jgi:hypothetical protein
MAAAKTTAEVYRAGRMGLPVRWTRSAFTSGAVPGQVAEQQADRPASTDEQVDRQGEPEEAERCRGQQRPPAHPVSMRPGWPEGPR